MSETPVHIDGVILWRQMTMDDEGKEQRAQRSYKEQDYVSIRMERKAGQYPTAHRTL